MSISLLTRGQSFDRRQIANMIGGGALVTYLPSKGGKILAGCFDPKLNQRAPLEIDVGASDDVVERARTLAKTNGIIPVFLKKQSNKWEYVGTYQCTEFSQLPDDITAYEDRREDAVGVLYFREVPSESVETVPAVET